MFNQKVKYILLLAARLVIGGIFVIQGWNKVSGMEGTVGFFSQMGLPAAVAYLVAYGELLGGLAVILGLWLEWVAIGLGVIMLGAIYYVWPMGLRGFGFPLSLFGGLLALLATGPGNWALSFKKREAGQQIAQ